MFGSIMHVSLLVQVHAYVAAPGGRTAYLSELSTGDQVLVADASGNVRPALVGRTMVERRCLVRQQQFAAMMGRWEF